MSVSDFDVQARATIQLLSRAFELASPAVCDEPFTSSGRVSMGLEIEVPWSSYFPELWQKYGLANRKVYALPKEDLDVLSAECAEIEKVLLPRLHKTVECGVPRGNDRYWEFALRPACDARLLAEQVELMTEAGVLPRDKRHSLQVTIGGIPPCKSLYKLCMLLEVEFVDPERIRSGIEQMKSTIHTGWARKGRAGVHAKSADELQGGEQVASEIRLLQLPTSRDDFQRMMSITQYGVNAIQDLREGLDTEQARQWRLLEQATERVLVEHGLPDQNWFSPGVSHEVWDRFADRLDQIRVDLLEQAPSAVLALPAQGAQKSARPRF